MRDLHAVVGRRAHVGHWRVVTCHGCAGGINTGFGPGFSNEGGLAVRCALGRTRHAAKGDAGIAHHAVFQGDRKGAADG